MGEWHWNADDDAAKKERSIGKSKWTTSVEYGVRVMGAKSYKTDVRKYVVHGKDRGRSLNRAGLDGDLAWFFSDGRHPKKILRMKVIRDNMRREKHFKFYSSSILVVYEGDGYLPILVDVRTLDFAKAQCVENAIDEGFVLGVDSLVAAMEAVFSMN